MNAIEVRNLVKRYGNFLALNDVTFNVKKGESFALLGPNGAGKTTFVRILSGQVKPTSGEVRVFGENTREFSKNVKKRLGVISHNTFLYDDLSAWENLGFYGKLYGVESLDKKIKEILSKMNLYERADDLVRNFSRGMKQRLAIARALLHSPDLVILDEPTAGLDIQSRMELFRLIDAIKAENRTIVFTTHNLEEVYRVCDVVAIMNKGQVLEITEVKESLDLKEYYLSLVEGS
jgi:heme ABC exporter ATP-binding subunit CcmA